MGDGGQCPAAIGLHRDMAAVPLHPIEHHGGRRAGIRAGARPTPLKKRDGRGHVMDFEGLLREGGVTFHFEKNTHSITKIFRSVSHYPPGRFFNKKKKKKKKKTVRENVGAANRE